MVWLDAVGSNEDMPLSFTITALFGVVAAIAVVAADSVVMSISLSGNACAHV